MNGRESTFKKRSINHLEAARLAPIKVVYQPFENICD